MISLNKLQNYHNQAKVIAQQSPDEQTKVASLLIHGKTGAVLGSGFNGFIRGGPDHALPKTRPEKYDYIIHAETNMLYNCARHGISTDECFVYCTMSPCVNCLRALYQSGISVVYFKYTYRDFDKNLSMIDVHLIIEEKDGFYKVEIQPRKI